MSTQGYVLYNDQDGNPTTSSELRFDDSTQYPDSRLNAVNLTISEDVHVAGRVGAATANPRENLEVTGYTLLVGQGSDSQNPYEFGLNGEYDTLALMTRNGIGTGGRMSIFFGLQSIINYPVARIVAADERGLPSLSFQTGRGSALVDRIKIDTTGNTNISGDLIINGSSFLYKSYTVPAIGSASVAQAGTITLNFPSINDNSSATIDVDITFSRFTDTGSVKFTVYLSFYTGVAGSGIFINNLSSMLSTDNIVIDPRRITSSSSSNLASVSVPYSYKSQNLQQIISIRYSIQGPYASQMNQYGISMTAS